MSDKNQKITLDDSDLQEVDSILLDDSDLSEVDKILAEEESSSIPEVPIVSQNVKPQREAESIKEELTGMGIGTTGGYIAGKALSKPLEKKALDIAASSMGFGKQISEELGDVEKRRLAKMAMDKEIFGIFSNAEDQKAKVSSLLENLGREQAALYSRVSPKTEKMPIKNLLEQFKALAAPKLSADRSEMTAYRQAIRDLENLSSPTSGDLKVKSLGLEGLQELKKTYGDLAYKEGKSMVGNTDKASMAQKGNRVTRQAIEDLISAVPNVGDTRLDELKNINKQYSDISKIQPGISRQAGKAAANQGILNTLKEFAVDSSIRAGVKGAVKGAKHLPKVGGVIGAVVGGMGGALAAEEGQKAKGAAFGVAEAFRPVETLGVSELPKTQIGKEALEAEMKQRAEEGKLSKEIRDLPVEEKVQVVDALKSKLDYTPEEMQQVSEKLLALKGGESYANILNQAAQQSDRSRKSVIWGLLQQPAFRELMKKVNNAE